MSGSQKQLAVSSNANGGDDGNNPPPVVYAAARMESETSPIGSGPEGFFSFSKQGKLRWWSAIILALYVAGTLSAVLVLIVCSVRRTSHVSNKASNSSSAAGESAFTTWQPS
ncbi:uncharacterized protein Tco025E_05471 [Trypanosoma conorhini]|uniref:Transmembrane protein n=1 Tax=Trypanosoma conorhini TaxID=83891 RepID=A0A3R7KUQ5_9TRYP|nr:uncharacterized protein Tco025E_05471 [Trypanosoma conorhini]RNF15607.1 hypothetical protein Tco025E_05471 [Trypanosoma conorhini]